MEVASWWEKHLIAGFGDCDSTYAILQLLNKDTPTQS
jgi:hypothetical protein